jgi:hypothetical protein
MRPSQLPFYPSQFQTHCGLRNCHSVRRNFKHNAAFVTAILSVAISNTMWLLQTAHHRILTIAIAILSVVPNVALAKDSPLLLPFGQVRTQLKFVTIGPSTHTVAIPFAFVPLVVIYSLAIISDWPLLTAFSPSIQGL